MKYFGSPEPIRLPFGFDTHAEATAVVRDFDRAFDARLDAAADEIAADCVANDIRILRLSGPTCAGKTTTAGKLTRALEAEGRVVHPISIDDFFYDRAVLEAKARNNPGGELDYDSVETIDLDCLSACIHDLMNKGCAQIPHFDFVTGDRMGYREMTVPMDEKPVFLFEGIQAVYPAVVALFSDVPDRSIFINVMKPTTLYGVGGHEQVFEPDRIRLFRRLVRDEARRGTSASFTLHLWRSVRANEMTSILPYADACDWGIDSNMAFDVHLLTPHLRRILTPPPEGAPPLPNDRAIDADMQAAMDAILHELRDVEGLPPAGLSDGSLYREFLTY